MKVPLILLMHSYFSGATGYLLAQSHFSQDGLSVTTLLIAAGVLIALGAAGWVAFQYLHPDKRKHCPKRLFRELCREHKLAWSEKTLLKKLVLRHQLAAPADIFVSPECFDVSDGRAQQAVLQQIDDLRAKLFGA